MELQHGARREQRVLSARYPSSFPASFISGNGKCPPRSARPFVVAKLVDKEEEGEKRISDGLGGRGRRHISFGNAKEAERAGSRVFIAGCTWKSATRCKIARMIEV